MKKLTAAFALLILFAAASYAGCNAEESVKDVGGPDASTGDSGTIDSGSSDGSTDGSTDGSIDGGAPDGSKQNVPDPSFFTPVSPKNIQLNFKGLINSYQDVVDGSDTEGIGASKITLASTTVELNEMASAFTYTFPDDYPRQSWRGEAFVMINLYHTREGGADYAWYDTVQFYVPVKEMLAAKSSGNNIFAFGTMSAAWMTDLKIKVRKDKVYMRRDCFTAVADSAVAESKYFVNPEDNTGFIAGENVKIWGNIAITDDKTTIASRFSGLEEDGGQLCRFYKDSKLISRDQYYKDIEVEFDLDCAMPDKYLEPASADYAVHMFRGPINDSGSTNTANGVGQFKVHVGDKDLVVDDYSTYSIRFMNGKDPTMAVVSLGSVESLGTGHYTYLSMEEYVGVESLTTLKTEGKNLLNFAGYNIASSISKIEQKDKDQKSYFKQCVQAVIADDTLSSIFVCHDGNTDFSAGEALQLAGNLVLTADADDIADYLGSPEPCFCYDSDNASIDCTDFNDM